MRTSSETKMAVPAPTDTAKDSAHTADSNVSKTNGDKLTVLETIGPLLTKHYKADGSVDPYDDAASFKIKEVEVSNIDDLHALLTDLQTMHKNSIIRGKFVGKETAVQANKKGTYARTNQNFTDQPLHAIMIDIDKYKPGFGDPVEEPEICIDGFIRKILPKAFHDATYHWQLSSSAGKKGSEDILKAHVWFWLEKPYKCSELAAWGKVIGPMIDSVPFRRVQHHYTANPVFDEGIPDPVPVRSGLCRRAVDSVPLVIGEDTLSAARESGSGQGGSDMKVLDPSEKDGLIGAFHKAFSAEQVLGEILEGFEQVTQRRWTWHDGGGTPEGVWVHDDDMHVGSSHNTWPIDGLANLWDLTRVFKFGHLDHAEDDFEQLNIDSLPIQAKPSHLAMCEFVADLDEVKNAVREARTAELRHWIDKINNAADMYEIEHVVAPKIKVAEISKIEREALVNAVVARSRALSSPINKDLARGLLSPPRRTLAADVPRWIDEWVWVSNMDKFMNLRTKQAISMLSFNAQFDREMHPDADGVIPKASDMALRVWGVPIVAGAEYHPMSEAEYKEIITSNSEGMAVVNTYRPDLLPAMPDHYSSAEKLTIEMIKLHIELLVPDETDRNLFLDYLAHNVQHPGMKIRWAPLLIGIEGDGKTHILNMIGAVMGSKNYRILNNKTLSSDFTGWAGGQCLVGIEEVKLHNSDRFDIFNALKPIISNSGIEVHSKGKDPMTMPNYSNLFMLTNHPDALPVTANDRRIFFLKTPFNNKEDLEAAMFEKSKLDPKDYWKALSDNGYLKHTGAVRKWFMERDIADFDPNSQAPMNEMRKAAIAMSCSDEELAVRDVIEDGALGVYPTLIAGGLLTKAVADKYDGLKVSTTRLNDIMLKLCFAQFADSSRKWMGKSYRWYIKGKKPHSLTVAAETMEAERQARLLEGDFTD